MAVRQPRYTPDEHARRGTEAYELLRPTLEPENIGRFVAIDIETGEYELGKNTLEAAERLLARIP